MACAVGLTVLERIVDDGLVENSAADRWYDALLNTPMEIRVGAFEIAMPLGVGDLIDQIVEELAELVAEKPIHESVHGTVEGDAERGQTLFATCTACHGAQGQGNQQLNAPPLNQMDDWYMLTQLKNFKHGVRGANPQDTTGGQMRPMAQGLTDEQAMRDVVAYIGTL